jgi:hypothetical protein
MYLLSRRIKAGIYIGLFAQFLWCLYILENKAWGLLPLNIVIWYICISGIQKWSQKAHN